VISQINRESATQAP